MISIHYSNGRVLQGVVLAFGDRLVRVAVKGCDDASEFRLVNRVWVSEDCEVVKLEFDEHEVPAEIAEADPLETLFQFELRHMSIQRVM